MIVDFKDQARWLSAHVVAIIAIVAIAVFAVYLGKMIITASVRKFVHGRHLGRPNQAITDVKKRQDTIINVALIVWKLVVFISAGIAIFSIVFPNVNLVPLLASASVIGAIIGFGAQSIIRDLISGSFILVENQFRVGDDVEIDGASGKVEHITLRSTVLRDDAAKMHYITNGSITHVINKTMGFSKVYFTLYVTADTDLDVLTEIIATTGKKLATEQTWQKKIIEAPTVVSIGEITGDTVAINIAGRTQAGEQYATTSEFKKRLLSAIRTNRHITLAQFSDNQPAKK